MKSVTHLQFLLLSVALPLAGCATLSGEQCRNADWFALGMSDGEAGRGAWYAKRHAGSCRDHGIAMAVERYHSGRERGLRLFCTPENGYRWGREGNDFTRVCPADLAEAFEKAYDSGRAAHLHEQEMKSLELWMMRGIIHEQRRER